MKSESEIRAKIVEIELSVHLSTLAGESKRDILLWVLDDKWIPIRKK